MLTQSDNRFFFIGFFLFLISGLIVLLLTEKGATILYFSEHRSAFGNAFFSYGTKLGEHYMYIIAILSCLFIRYRYALLFPILGILVTIVSAILKRYFAHPRPMRYFEMTDFAETINLVPSQKVYMAFSSFPSGHTMSGFAVFTLLALISTQNKFKIFFLTLAIIVGISRIYLVHHFLEDVLFGAFLGVILATLLFRFQSQFPARPHLWYNKNLTIRN